MNHQHTKRNVLLICLVAAPLLQLVGDSLWVNGNFKYSWSIWREASYIFFIPAGFFLARVIEPRSARWAIATCGMYVIGCFGSATMMPLFRLGAFYPVEGHNQFPAIVQSVLGRNAFALTLFPPGLCFPVSLVLFGIGFIKYRLFHTAVGTAFIIAGLLFWLGNAMELDPLLIAGDAWLLLVFSYIGHLLFKERIMHRRMNKGNMQHQQVPVI